MYIHIKIILIIIMIGLIIYKVKYMENENKKIEGFELINLDNLKGILVRNLQMNTGTIIKIPMEQVETEDCDLKCDAENCKIMKEMKKNLTKCVECHKNPKKCFRKSIIGGNCDDCLPDEKQINCSDTREFGCAPPDNIQSYNGVLPYFINIPSSDLNSPYDKKCVFCWQFSDYI